MSENIVEQIGRIEAEADRIIAEARQRARALESSVDEQVASMRREHEKALGERSGAFEAKLREETAARLEEIEHRTREARGRLQSLDPRVVEHAEDLILKHLREDAQWQ